MSSFDKIDYFTDADVVRDPHPYFDYLRSQGPAVRMSPHGVVAVTGYDTGLALFRDDDHFSSVNAPTGPIPPLPFTPEGDDITAQIEQYRDQIPAAGLIACQDPPAHAKTKALLMGMITPRRLQENEQFMVRLADRTIDEFVGRGSCDVVAEYAQPFATLVIADLLGVPEQDHDNIRKLLRRGGPGQISGNVNPENNPLASIGAQFYHYIEDRRSNPRSDVLTALAQQRYADGSLPEVVDVVMVATFLFAAGQDTTVKVIAAALRHLGENPELQLKLRAQRHLIPEFIEEVLRLDGTVKNTFRLAKVPVKVGDLDVAPGTTVMLTIGAMNRDPAKFDDPHQLRLDRKNVREHVAFGRGIHSCPGAPLARAEAKVTLERFFDRTADIRIDESRHGPAGARRYEYDPTYILRGMSDLHIEFTPVG